MYLRFLFVVLLFAPAVAFAGTEAALPESVKQSLERALATNDAFVIEATFAAAMQKHPGYKQDILALLPGSGQKAEVKSSQVFVPQVVAAPVPAKEENATWTGKVGAAFDKETGNTQTESFLAEVTVQRESEKWRHKLSGRARFASEDGTKINEDYRSKIISDWKFSEQLFVFGEAEYITDKFSGFDYRVTESVGLGSRWKWDSTKSGKENSFFDLRASVGGRHSRETDATEAAHNAIFRPAMELDWQISDLLNLNQKAKTTIGTDVTISNSETNLSYAINSRLALKLAFELEHTSSVPPGTEKLETYTSTGLTYKLFDK